MRRLPAFVPACHLPTIAISSVWLKKKKAGEGYHVWFWRCLRFGVTWLPTLAVKAATTHHHAPGALRVGYYRRFRSDVPFLHTGSQLSGQGVGCCLPRHADYGFLCTAICGASPACHLRTRLPHGVPASILPFWRRKEKKEGRTFCCWFF